MVDGDRIIDNERGNIEFRVCLVEIKYFRTLFRPGHRRARKLLRLLYAGIAMDVTNAMSPRSWRTRGPVNEKAKIIPSRSTRVFLSRRFPVRQNKTRDGLRQTTIRRVGDDDKCVVVTNKSLCDYVKGNDSYRSAFTRIDPTVVNATTFFPRWSFAVVINIFEYGSIIIVFFERKWKQLRTN